VGKLRDASSDPQIVSTGEVHNLDISRRKPRKSRSSGKKDMKTEGGYQKRSITD
jgi:hypothetical protein